MRLLVLSPLLPSVGGSGGQTRELHLLRRVAAHGHDVVVCCPVPREQRPRLDAARAAGLDVRAADRPPSRLAEVARAVRTRPALLAAGVRLPVQPWQLEVLWQGMAAEVERAWAERRPDAVLVVWDLAAGWIAHLPEPVPAAIDLHDVSAEYARSRAASAPGRVAAAWLDLEARRLERFARRRLGRYDAVVCVSDEEAGRLARLVPGSRPEVVPNGVDLDAFRAAPERDGPPRVVFTGTMNYPPNAEAAAWLVREVWPRVRRAHPAAELAVVGRDPGPAVRALGGRDGVTVTGAVPAVAPYLEAAHVVAVPILSGGGTRLKVLEAAAAGRAVVATSRGAEGLALRPGTDLEVADEPGAFAARLSALLGDPPRRRALGGAARRTVEARYGWPALGDRLTAVLERVATTARTSRQ